jgi:5-methylcytosine-specific restriction endonuclease McrBC regulatory subunit McrC
VPNSDIYQVIAYGTVLQCADVFLLYPQTELDSEHDIDIINSPIVVKTRRIDISSSDCVENAEAVAENIVFECQQNPANIRTTGGITASA